LGGHTMAGRYDSKAINNTVNSEQKKLLQSCCSALSC